MIIAAFLWAFFVVLAPVLVFSAIVNFSFKIGLRMDGNDLMNEGVGSFAATLLACVSAALFTLAWSVLALWLAALMLPTT